MDLPPRIGMIAYVQQRIGYPSTQGYDPGDRVRIVSFDGPGCLVRATGIPWAPKRWTRIDRLAFIYEACDHGDEVSGWYSRPPRLSYRMRLMRKVIARDGLTCWLCHRPVNLALRGDGEPSLDHVTPVSRGGTDAMRNLRLAHKRCNKARSSRDPDEAREHIAALMQRGRMRFAI